MLRSNDKGTNTFRKITREVGLIFAAMAGYDPQQAIPFWQRMSQGNLYIECTTIWVNQCTIEVYSKYTETDDVALNFCILQRVEIGRAHV